MKLCDRCRVPDCPLGYLSRACETAREKWCPDVQPNNAEIIANMSLEEMGKRLIPMIAGLFKDSALSQETFETWLASPYEKQQHEKGQGVCGTTGIPCSGCQPGPCEHRRKGL